MAGLLFLWPVLLPPPLGTLGDVHWHMDLNVYLNGFAYNFSQQKYMETKNISGRHFIHLHDLDGEIIHKHISGATLGMFFRSIGMSLDPGCFKLDGTASFCNDASNTIKLFVNGTRRYDFDRYVPQDLDRILISYGPADDPSLSQQIASVGDRACIPSGKCPERGLPGNESSCTSQADCGI